MYAVNDNNPPRRPSRLIPAFWAVLRYVGVLAIWSGLLIVRPHLALEILRDRRPDSPIPRFGRRGLRFPFLEPEPVWPTPAAPAAAARDWRRLESA